MEGITWIKHKGKEILFADMSLSKNEEETVSMLNEVDNIIASRPKGSVLYLTNMKDAYISPTVMGNYKNAATRIKENARAWAVIGMSPVKKMIMDLLRKTIGISGVVFESTEEAKDWLVNQ